MYCNSYTVFNICYVYSDIVTHVASCAKPEQLGNILSVFLKDYCLLNWKKIIRCIQVKKTKFLYNINLRNWGGLKGM